MSAPDLDVQVAIVGGGPAGLMMAMLLAQHGIDVELFERRAHTARLPRAHLINQRTMEIFDSVGLADDVRAMSPPEDQWHRVGWYTSLAGDLPGSGRRIGHVQAWGGDSDAERYERASPQGYANLPQMRLDPLLREHASWACPGRIHFGHEVTDLVDLGDSVEVTVVAPTGAARTLRAAYVVAADGGRFCADRLGIEMVGPVEMRAMSTLYFTADLSPWIEDEQSLLYYFVNPQGQGDFDGALCAMGPTRWGRFSEEWSYHLAFAWGDPAAYDEPGLVARMRETLGVPDLDLELHTVSHWELEGVVAQRLRKGRVFLAGNAAHRHPPSGGLGLNTSVQDVYNLAWKLAMVLQGTATDELLWSYHSERHQVSDYNVRHALENVGGHRRVAAALGLFKGQELQDGWREIDLWLSETAAGAARRHDVEQAIKSNSDDYGQLNVELGYRYRSSAVVADSQGATGDDASFAIQEYVPSTVPGHHLPHAWLDGEHGTTSTYTTFAPTAFALLVGPEGHQAWSTAVTTVRGEVPVDITVVTIGPGLAFEDRDRGWAPVRGVSDSGALLVRPDRHVAWRAADLPADPAAALLATLQQIL